MNRPIIQTRNLATRQFYCAQILLSVIKTATPEQSDYLKVGYRNQLSG
jgi:hypothetical protein